MLISSAPIGMPATLAITGANPLVTGYLYLSADTPLPPLDLGNGCLVHRDLGTLVLHGAFPDGRLRRLLAVVRHAAGAGVRRHAREGAGDHGDRRRPAAFELTNALRVSFGY